MMTTNKLLKSYKQLIAFKIAKQLIPLVGNSYYNNLTDFIVALSCTCNIIKELKYATDIVILTLKIDHMHNQICQQLIACWRMLVILYQTAAAATIIF